MEGEVKKKTTWQRKVDLGTLVSTIPVRHDVQQASAPNSCCDVKRQSQFGFFFRLVIYLNKQPSLGSFNIKQHVKPSRKAE